MKYKITIILNYSQKHFTRIFSVTGVQLTWVSTYFA